MLKMKISVNLKAKSVLVALGGNLPSSVGEPGKTLTYAMANLRLCTNSLMYRSRFFSTPCFPVGYGPDYVNGAVEFKFRGEANELLDILHEIEAMFGRARDARWCGRVLDLDLLTFGDIIAPSLNGYAQWRDMPLSQQIQQTPKEMILPHPRLQDRAFVLGPLMDIAPDWRHPVFGLTVRQMYGRLSAADRDALRPMPEQ
jgi:2-amino-4-hydroxy-6-hydroxymethyldihydropteridine diphosphokinase|tara:strand:+ start:706 stop:1305 length:600 start_codon:yes stop_codon:yes gene_type:complete